MVELEVSSIKFDVQKLVNYIAYAHSVALLQVYHVLILQVPETKLFQVACQLLYCFFNVSSEISEVYENAKFFDLFCTVKRLKRLTFSLLRDISQ